MMFPKRVLVTGCSGYIGSHLVTRLREAGVDYILGLDRKPYLGTQLDDFVQADILDVSDWQDLLSRIDCICHLAAARTDWGISDEEYYRDNVEATRLIIGAGKKAGIKLWVFYSSVAVMGPSSIPLTETSPPRPVNAYGKSKALAERLFHQFSNDQPDARIVILRPSAVFGPGHPSDSNIYRLIESIRSGRFVMVGDGSNHKSTSALDNLLAAHLFLMERARPGVQTYIYVDEPVLTTREIVEQIYSCLGRSTPRLYLPLWLAKSVGYVGTVIGSITRTDVIVNADRVQKFCSPTNYSAAKIRAEGFVPPVALPEAIERTVQWHVERIRRAS